MTIIPKPLRKRDFRFVKINTKDKRPFEKDWQNTNNYLFDNTDLLNWLNNNNNYGIVCGKGDLAIIDCDEPEIAEIVETNLPKTFTVRTGSGGKHYYFIIRDMNKTMILQKPILDENKKIINKKHCGEIRSVGSQVVAPNSIHPNGNKYEIYNYDNIAEINKTTIDILFKQYINIEKDKPNNNKKDYHKYRPIDITKIIDISKFTRHGNEYQGSHPIHGSTTGMNFSINADKCVWHCFRCGTGGGIVSLIAILNGIILCDSCREGCITPIIFKEVVELAKTKYGIIIDEGE